MNQERREQLKRASLNFINSEQFIGYLQVLYESIIRDPGMLMNIRDEYVNSMKDARIEMGCLWMVNSALTSGQVSVAPGLLISGAHGTEESEEYVRYICGRLKAGEWSNAEPVTVQSAFDMINEERFSLFRGRTLPLDLTENYPVYLFDSLISADCLLEQEGQVFPHVACLINPEGRVKVFTIPLFVHALAYNF
jgi:hypothetical protein